MQDCTDLSLQDIFPVRTNQGKTGARVRVHAAAHQEENENTGKKERQEKNS